MRLSKLTLTDFRGFERLEVSLHESVTVFVGVNGSGKSTVLDAIVLTLGPWIGAGSMGAGTDVRIGAEHAVIDLELMQSGTGGTVGWTMSRTSGPASRGGSRFVAAPCNRESER